MKQFQGRQGDIWFEECSDKPDNLKPKHDQIIAYGEVTGHSHKVVSPALSDMDMMTDEKGDIWVHSKDQEIRVGHDEHDTIVLPANKWICITRQREFDPLAAEKEHIVAD